MFALTLTLLAGAPLLVAAQESGSKQYGTLEGQNENRYYETNAEGDPANLKIASRQDSLSSKQSLRKPLTDSQKQNAKKSPNDSEPFNFLYFIIQRFKTSDIIED